MISISIIIPVYKVEAYIEECLASVVAQKDAAARVECIVVDDCSPDGSMDIVRRFVDDYRGEVVFRLLRHEKNRGLSAARNTGINAATGDYLYFLDSDDFLTPDCLSTMLRGLSLCPDADVVQANLTDGRNSDSPYYDASAPVVLKDRKSCLMALAYGKMPVCACNRLVRRTTVIDRHLYFIEGIIHEDNPWSYQLLGVASGVVILPDQTYYYRYEASSITHTRRQNIMKLLHSWNVILDTILGLEKNVRGYILMHVFSRMLEAKDMMSQQDCTEEERALLKEILRKLHWKALLYLRPMLSVWLLTIHKPFYAIYSYPIVRHKYGKIEMIVSRVEAKIDSLTW